MKKNIIRTGARTIGDRREHANAAPVAWACPSPLLPSGSTELTQWCWMK